MSDSATDDAVELEMAVADGRTEIRVSGDRDTAVVVRSSSGEKIYLPPEDFERPPERDRKTTDSPYQSGGGPGDGASRAGKSTDSPYQSGGGLGSPYQSGRPSGDSPYQSGRGSGDSSYQAAQGTGGSSYQSAPDAEPEPETGMRPTADGFVIVHPEPVTDLRFLR